MQSAALGGTKERILKRLARAPAAADEIARELGLSRVAVQRHLKDLHRRGLLAFEERRNGGPGRPRRLWRRVDPEAPYLGLCDLLLAELRAALGPGGLTERVAEAQERRLRAALEGLSGEDRLQRLVALLREGAYQTEVGEGELRQRRCPRLELAERFPELCRAEAQAYARVLGRPVRLMKRIPDGHEVCLFRLGE